MHLFRDVFGRQVPPAQWDPDPSVTRQGVYCMMPDGTYLGAKHAGAWSGHVLPLLREAQQRWLRIKEQRGLHPKPIPRQRPMQQWIAERAGKAGLLLALHYRDLPRGEDTDRDGGRIGESWNRRWMELDREEARALVPETREWQAVPASLARRLARMELKDIVHGQSPEWSDQHVRKSALRVRRTGEQGGVVTIELRGDFDLRDGKRRFRPALYGEAVFDSNTGRFTSFQAFAAGPRTGGTTYNFRGKDPGPAPLGISLVMEDGRP
ncbi:MAG: hypothetical protein HKN82_07945 [Akkermansiaceae bacterium]|nr:hypothetical protein [Akkermansiaceae bacterium]NNM29325.1 hypothetical protein [Akkermansiaceae bacterium]